MPRSRRVAPALPECTGFVSLIGAGPGAPDLITLRGQRALAHAEVILQDALVPEAFREGYAPGAQVIDVGKRCGRHRAAQEEIQEQMIHHARLGRRVARLKGGDPLIFGRGGEEILALEKAGIPFEIIPGISAFQAGAAAAGIPLTHRGVSRRVTLLEGCHLPDSPAGWRELVQGGGTLAVYMGTRRIADLAQALLEHGASPDLPVTLLENISQSDQILTGSTLALAARNALVPRTPGPGLLLLGESLNHRITPRIAEHPIHPRRRTA